MAFACDLRLMFGHVLQMKPLYFNVLSSLSSYNNTRFSDVYLKDFKRFPHKIILFPFEYTYAKFKT